LTCCRSIASISSSLTLYIRTGPPLVVPDDEYRTAVTRLEVSETDRQLLERTISEWQRGCNIAVEKAWGNHDLASRRVQSIAYDEIREQTDLKSQHAVLATHHAAEAMRSCVEQLGYGAATKPSFTAPTIRYGQRSMTLFEDESISLTTIESRVRCPLALPEEADGYQYQFLDDDSWSLTQSTLTIRDGTFYLHLGFRRPLSPSGSTAEDGTVLGVDLGLDNLAVTSTAQFFSGGQLRHRRQEFERVREGLQQTRTRSAYRTLSRVNGRERRYARDVLHRVANGILAEALRYRCDKIAFESLDDIRNRIPEAGYFHRWAFRLLRSFVEYKARDSGIDVVTVDPSNTSRRCSDCGHTAAENRPTRDQFVCQKCGNEANADYNAAKNVGLRYVRRGLQSSRRTGASRCALKSGTVTPNGNFSPYPDGFEAEFSDKAVTG